MSARTFSAWGRTALKGLLTALVVLAALWGRMAMVYQVPAPWLQFAGFIWVVLALLALLAIWLRRPLLRWQWLPFGLAFAFLLHGWLTLIPSHNRLWADDVAQLLTFERHGDQLLLYNVRNFTWAEDGSGDYVAGWATRHYDLSQLESADLLLSYWMGPSIAHTLVSYGFADGRQLVFSLEIRKERHETFSPVAGFFRQYEAVLIAADENDIVRTRTNARGETVHLYRLAMNEQALRESLLGYLERAESIRQVPEFYNTVTSNCTTIVFQLARRLVPGLPLDWRLLASGYFAQYAFEHGGLTPGVSYAALQNKGDITERARAFAGLPFDFSAAIRQGVPGIQPPAPP